MGASSGGMGGSRGGNDSYDQSGSGGGGGCSDELTAGKTSLIAAHRIYEG